MKKISFLKELEGYAVFTNKTVRELTHKSKSYTKLLVYRLKKDGLITEIEKNKYTLQKDPLAVASSIVWPSYISCWTAIRYHNLTEQLPQDVFVITTRAKKRRGLSFGNSRILFMRVKPKYFFGFRKGAYGNFTIFIAEKEKALIDSALLKKISFSELSAIAMEHKDELDMRLLIEYLDKIKNKTLIKRFGFLLEKLGYDFYSELKGFINAPYIPLDYSAARKGKKNKKWKVIENVNI